MPVEGLRPTSSLNLPALSHARLILDRVLFASLVVICSVVPSISFVTELFSRFSPGLDDSFSFTTSSVGSVGGGKGLCWCSASRRSRRTSCELVGTFDRMLLGEV